MGYKTMYIETKSGYYFLIAYNYMLYDWLHLNLCFSSTIFHVKYLTVMKQLGI